MGCALASTVREFRHRLRPTGRRPARDFTPAVERLGLAGIRFHDLRHTGSTLAAATGASLADLMARMGARVRGRGAALPATRTQDVVIAGALLNLITQARPA